jgi:hypothetical protein
MRYSEIQAVAIEQKEILYSQLYALAIRKTIAIARNG